MDRHSVRTNLASFEFMIHMKVLYLSSSSGSEGGGESYLVELSREVARFGHEIELWLSKHPRMDALSACAARGVCVRRVRYVSCYDRRLRCVGSLLDWRGIRRMAKILRDSSCDLVHLNKQNLEDGLDLLLAARLANRPTVTTIHVTRPLQALGAAMGKIRDAVAYRALTMAPGSLLTIARSCERDLHEFLRESPATDRIACIPNGVADIGSQISNSDHRSEWGFSATDIIIGCVARIEEQKNPLFLIDVLAALPKAIKLVWVGDGRLRRAMETRCQELQLLDRVRLDGWRDDVHSRMRAFDVFALPSIYEGLPFALLEAMSCRLPVVASNVDGIRDVICDRTNGILVPPTDRSAWTKALLAMVSEPEMRSSLGKAARATFEADHNLAVVAVKTVALYEEVIANWHSQPSI